MALALGKDLLQRAAHHEGDQFPAAHRADRLGGNLLTIFEHRHRVGDLENFVEPMRNIDHRDPRSLKGTDDRKELGQLFPGQNRRRFVHHDQVGLLRKGLSDLNDLLAGHGQITNLAIGVERDAEPCQQRLGLGNQAPLVDHAKAIARLVAEKDILRHTHQRQQVEFLIDNANAQIERLARGEMGIALPLEDNLPTVGLIGPGENLHQRRFTRPIFAQQRMDRTRFTGKRNIRQRPYAGECFRNMVHGQQWLRHGG